MEQNSPALFACMTIPPIYRMPGELSASNQLCSMQHLQKFERRVTDSGQEYHVCENPFVLEKVITALPLNMQEFRAEVVRMNNCFDFSMTDFEVMSASVLEEVEIDGETWVKMSYEHAFYVGEGEEPQMESA